MKIQKPGQQRLSSSYKDNSYKCSLFDACSREHDPLSSTKLTHADPRHPQTHTHHAFSSPPMPQRPYDTILLIIAWMKETTPLIHTMPH